MRTPREISDLGTRSDKIRPVTESIGKRMVARYKLTVPGLFSPRPSSKAPNAKRMATKVSTASKGTIRTARCCTPFIFRNSQRMSQTTAKRTELAISTMQRHSKARRAYGQRDEMRTAYGVPSTDAEE